MIGCGRLVSSDGLVHVPHFHNSRDRKQDRWLVDSLNQGKFSISSPCNYAEQLQHQTCRASRPYSRAPSYLLRAYCYWSCCKTKQGSVAVTCNARKDAYWDDGCLSRKSALIEATSILQPLMLMLYRSLLTSLSAVLLFCHSKGRIYSRLDQTVSPMNSSCKVRWSGKVISGQLSGKKVRLIIVPASWMLPHHLELLGQIRLELVVGSSLADWIKSRSTPPVIDLIIGPSTSQRSSLSNMQPNLHHPRNCSVATTSAILPALQLAPQPAPQPVAPLRLNPIHHE